MPNVVPIYLPRRWITYARRNHLVAESDDGHHLTMCRLLTRGEPIFHGTVQNVRWKCAECERQASSTGVYIGTEGVRPNADETPARMLTRIVKTRGGRIYRKKLR